MTQLQTSSAVSRSTTSGRPGEPLRSALERSGCVLNLLHEVVFQTSAAGHWTFLSAAWTQVLGRDVRATLGTPAETCIHPQDRQRFLTLLQPGVQVSTEPVCHVIRFMAQDGTLRWIEVWAQPLLGQGDAAAGMAGILRDVTSQRRTEERLRLTASVFDSVHESIVITDVQGHIVEVNDAFEAHTGYPREQAIGRTPAMLSSGRHDAAFFRMLWDSLLSMGQWSGEVWNRRADGEVIAQRVRIRAVHDSSGERTHYVAVYTDVTSQKQQQEDLTRLAHYDGLTELPNRVLALDRLGQLIGHAQRHGLRVAVVQLDLDGFQEINERLGHVQGDGLLIAAAQRLGQAVRIGDTVARSGGDEFLVLLGNISGVAAVEPLLQRVQEALAQTPAQPDGAVRVTASMGVALFPEHGRTPEHLLRAADQAMYRAKQLGKNRACMAGEGNDRPVVQEALLDELRIALATGQLCLHYQPKVCARTGQAHGAEVLVRWQHPQRGLLAPGAFLPAVVGTPLEVELDLWVICAAVAQLARWRDHGRQLQLSINVSPGTLVLPRLAETVAGIVGGAAQAQHGKIEGIELEVVETAALDDLGAASRAIEACARHGISFALDDFGTGYSSLSYLQQLPVSTLKIDRSFVGNMLTRQADLHIVRAVIGLADAFGITTVAEGVETQAHAELLSELGCHQLQGYGIARPMPAQALEAWLDARALQPALQ